MEFVRHIDDGLVVFNFFLTDLRKRDHTYEKFSEKRGTAMKRMARRIEKLKRKTDKIKKKLCLSKSADVEINASMVEENSKVLFPVMQR